MRVRVAHEISHDSRGDTRITLYDVNNVSYGSSPFPFSPVLPIIPCYSPASYLDSRNSPSVSQ